MNPRSKYLRSSFKKHEKSSSSDSSSSDECEMKKYSKRSTLSLFGAISKYNSEEFIHPSKRLEDILEHFGAEMKWPQPSIDEQKQQLCLERLQSLADFRLLKSTELEQLKINPVLKGYLIRENAGILQIAEGRRIEEIVELLGESRGWSADQINADISSLLAQQIRNERDIKVLTTECWRLVRVPALVKALLRKEVWRESQKQQLSIAEEQGNILSIVGFDSSKGSLKDSMALDESLLDRSISSFDRLNIASSQRITVRHKDAVYSVDRFCPHKGADLSKVSKE